MTITTSLSGGETVFVAFLVCVAVCWCYTAYKVNQ